MRPKTGNEDGKGEDMTALGSLLNDELAKAVSEYTEQGPRTELQICMFRIIKSVAFEACVACMVLAQITLLGFEVDIKSSDGSAPVWLTSIGVAFLAIYVVELSLRLFVYRCAFWHSGWNLLDFSIVAADFLMLVVDAMVVEETPTLGFLRIFRLLRLARSVKVVVFFPNLALMVKGLLHSLSIVLWGLFLLMTSVTVFGILAVQIIHPVNQRVASSGAYDTCERCGRAYESVGSSALTFAQQIIAGDSWGATNIPIIEEAPATALFFAVVFTMLELMMLNIILSVVVDSASKCAAEDYSALEQSQEKEFQKASAKLKELCAHLDEDNSGCLTKGELMDGFDNNAAFRQLMTIMQIQKDDIEAVFNIIDSDGSGDIQHAEFVNELHKMKSHDSHTMLVFMKYYIIQIKRLAEGIAAKSDCLPGGLAHGRSEGSEKAKRIESNDWRSSKDLLIPLDQAVMEARRIFREELCASVRDLTSQAESHSLVLGELRQAMPDASRWDRFPSGGSFSPHFSGPSARGGGHDSGARSEFNKGGAGGGFSSRGTSHSARSVNVPSGRCCQFVNAKEHAGRDCPRAFAPQAGSVIYVNGAGDEPRRGAVDTAASFGVEQPPPAPPTCPQKPPSQA